jgi:mannose-6-phosphate isomerase
MKQLDTDESIRPWGHYEVLLDAEYCKVKRIYVKPGQRLSYQYHHKRKETWIVVSGTARITIDDVTYDHQTGETVLIPYGAKHRMANPSDSQDMVLIEVQTGTYFGEDDIVRVEDDYDRPETYTT